MNHHEPTPRRRTTELVLGLGGLALVGAAGWWFLAGDEPGGRGELAGPVEDAVTPAAHVAADLTAAEERAQPVAEPQGERTAVAPSEVVESVDEVAAAFVGTGSLEGVFVAPYDLPRDAHVTLRVAGRQRTEDGTRFHEDAHDLPVGEPWTLAELAPATWRVKAVVEHEGRTWSSDTVELELAEGLALRGVTLALVEYAVEGFVTGLDGVPVANAVVEVEWFDQDDDFHFHDARDGWRSLTKGLEIAERHQVLLEERELILAQIAGLENELHGIRIRTGMSGVQLDELDTLVTFAPQEAAIEALVAQREYTTANIEFLEEVAFVEEAAEPDELDLTDVEIVEVEDTRPRTDAGGRYRLSLPGPGRFGLRVEGVDVELIAQQAQGEVTRVEPLAHLDLEVVRAATVLGTVSSLVGPLPDGVYCFLRLEGSDETDAESVDEDGAFRFERLLPGRYDFYARGGGEKGQDFSHHVQLEVLEGTEQRYDPALEPSYVVEGRLSGGDGDYTKLQLTAFGRHNPNLSRHATVRVDGTFRLEGLYASEYRLTVRRGKRELELADEATFYVDLETPPTFQEVVLAAPDGSGG